jgi:hypothetical protein
MNRVTLILPVAGESSRFPNMRPKWLLTLPDGKLLFEYSLSGLQADLVERIVIVALKDHIEKYSSEKFIVDVLSKYCNKVDIVKLDNPTKSQSQTVAEAIDQARVVGPIYIKDCDNYFETKIGSNNCISYCDLHDFDKVNAANKSYISVDEFGCVKNITEKKIISPYFCCGGYQFESAEEFLRGYNQVLDDTNLKEIYVSHVIYQMVINGSIFYTNKADNFKDIGTIKEYEEYTSRHITIFCDIDGVLLKNSSAFAEDPWGISPLENNIASLKKIMQINNTYLVVTTSRPLSSKEKLEKGLEALGIFPDQFVMGLPHSKRVLINDYSYTNKYPTAIAINLNRDDDLLGNLLMP